VLVGAGWSVGVGWGGGALVVGRVHGAVVVSVCVGCWVCVLCVLVVVTIYITNIDRNLHRGV